MPQPNAKGIAGRAQGQRKRAAAKTKRAAPAVLSRKKKRKQNTAVLDDIFVPILRHRN